MFEWKRRWQMEPDPGFQLTNAPGLPAEHPAQAGDLQEAILQRIILGVRPLGAAQSHFSQGDGDVQQDIGGAVEKEPEEIGLRKV